MDELITTDLILNWFKEQIQNKEQVDAHTWVDATQKLNILISDDHDKLFDLQQKVAQMRVALMEQGDTVSKAKAKVEATDEYKNMCKQKAKIGRIEEAIRIAKIQSRLKDSEFKGY